MNYNEVTSPCINVCKIDEPSQRCIGCHRTVDEITRWSRMDNDEKLAVIDGVVRRRRSLRHADSSDGKQNGEKSDASAHDNTHTALHQRGTD